MDIVIFGISGDLARKKLIPALSSLLNKDKPLTDTRLIGFSRSVKDIDIDASFQYAHIAGAYDSVASYEELKKKLRPEMRHLFYIALPPSAYKDVLTGIHSSGLVTKDDAEGQRIILVEKPFGQGLVDAEELLSLTENCFRLDQCLKVDHYAGKEELRNFKNLDISAIKEVNFKIREKATVEGRGGFYDTVGALRDVGQNHLLFMLATFFKGQGKREDVLEQVKIAPDPMPFSMGHYEGYVAIETSFSLSLVLDTLQTKDIRIRLHAAKAVNENKASIEIVYKDKRKKLITLSSGTVAYEKIFLDAMNGEQDSFLTDKEILISWRLIEDIEVIKKRVSMKTYEIGEDLQIM